MAMTKITGSYWIEKLSLNNSPSLFRGSFQILRSLTNFVLNHIASHSPSFSFNSNARASCLAGSRINKRCFWRGRRSSIRCADFWGQECAIVEKSVTKEIPPPQYLMHCPQFAFIRSGHSQSQRYLDLYFWCLLLVLITWLVWDKNFTHPRMPRVRLCHIFLLQTNNCI